MARHPFKGCDPRLLIALVAALLIFTPCLQAQSAAKGSPDSVVSTQTADAPPLSTSTSIPTSAVPSPLPDFWSTHGRLTFGLQFAFTLEHDSRPFRPSHIELLIVQPNLGLILKSFNRPGLPVSRVNLVSEGILGGAVHPHGLMLGQTLLFRLDGKPRNRLVPFLNVGAGVMNTTIYKNAPELSGATQFSPQGGMGIQYFFRKQRAFVIEYRYMHISNNNLQLPNLGFNSSMISVGIRWLRRPRPAPDSN